MNHRANASRRRKATDIVQKPWAQMRNRLPPTPLISEDEVENIHFAVLRVLAETGIRCHVPEARQVLAKAGALVDDANAMVRVGHDIVEQALHTVPSRITLTPRNPAHAVTIGGDLLATAAVIGPPHVSDLLRGRRSGSLADFSDFLRLTQFFNAVQMNGWSVEPLDIEVRHRHFDAAAAMLTLTDKVPYLFCQSRQRIEDVATLCAMARGETLEEFAATPGVYSIINTNTPLQYDVPMTIGVMEMARLGQPTVITPFTIASAATPATLASALVLNTAEILFGVALAQLVRPGAPVVYGCAVTNVDMKTGAPAYGMAEMLRGTLVGGQLARRYKMPMRSSNFSSANVADFESGMESANCMFAALTAGAHLILHAAGWMEGGLTSSFEKFVLDCELIQTMIHLLEPLDTSARALAVDEIAQVGPGGHFFGTERTIATFENAFYRPLLSNTQNYGAWLEAGGKDAAARATAVWQEALRCYEQPPLDVARKEQMTAFVARRREEGGTPLD